MTKKNYARVLAAVSWFFVQYKDQIASRRQKTIGNGKHSRNRAARLSDAQIITILIGFHQSSYRCFKHYYLTCRKDRAYFPLANL